MTNTEFSPWHAQMDYETGIVEVQFEGDWNEEKAIAYARESYPSLAGKILFLYPPSESKGYLNPGLAGIK